MSRALPPHPHLDHLKAQAKELLRQVRQSDAAALDRFRAVVAAASGARPTLVQAQRVVAREYGFPSWARLKAHVAKVAQGITPLDEIVDAFHQGDAPRLRELLTRHGELRELLKRPIPGGAFGTLPLIAAVSRGDRDLIDVLLDAGADPDARSEWWAGGFTALDEATPELAAYLLERGATLTPHAAARLGWVDRLRELLTADPALARARGGDGQTPLHRAVTAEIADLLLEHGADLDARDVDHESTPAQYLISEHPEVSRHLVELGCRTDLLLLAALGDVPRIAALLDRDPDAIRISVADEWFPRRNPSSGGTIYIWTLGWHRTPPLAAFERGHLDAYRLLLDRSPPSLRLATACEVGDETELRALRTEHPAPVLTDADRRRLPDAAQNQNPGAVRRLLDAGWPVEAAGTQGETALHWAAWHGDRALVEDLIRRGAPLEVRERRFGGTPLGWALHGSTNAWPKDEGDHAGVVTALLAAGATRPVGSNAEVSDAVRAVLEQQAAGG